MNTIMPTDDASQMLALMSLLGPTSLFLVAMCMRRQRELWLPFAATGLNLFIALGAAIAVASLGTLDSPLLGTAHVGLAVRLDGLSTTMFVLVGFVGCVVTRYSLTYLDRDPRQIEFMRGLLLTLGSVSLLVTAGSLVQLGVGWIATSASLHKMLLFHRNRHAAVIAARKKFLVARVGDALLFVACLLLVEIFQTTDIGTILERARVMGATGAGGSSVQIAALLLAGAALLKSAQFPSHGWLLEVMETPTPVSALLHAGIINAGGFLVLRLSDVFVAAPVSMSVLAVVGGVTALFGTLAMLCQPSIKVSLAYSTIAQMGFMLLQCGLGAFAAALVHIVTHSLYKAHAFLSSGSAVVSMRPLTGKAGRPGVATVGVGLAASALLVLGVAFVAGSTDAGVGAALLMGMLALSLSHYLIVSSRGGVASTLGAGVVAVGLAGMYLLLHAASVHILGDSLPGVAAPQVAIAAASMVALLFTGVVAWQARLRGTGQTTADARAYVLLKNGFYANVMMSRLVGAWRRT